MFVNPKGQLRLQNLSVMTNDENLNNTIIELQKMVINYQNYALYLQECVKQNKPFVKPLKAFVQKPEPNLIASINLNQLSYLN